jgi:hypothetical protein
MVNASGSMDQLIAPCECELANHWASLCELTVVVFTRDRCRQVARLLSSLAQVPCRVLVFDNGSRPLPDSTVGLSHRHEYTFRPGHWAANWRRAAVRVDTPFVCLVDDDGLLEPDGAANALCVLRRAPFAVAVEGATGDFVVQNRTAVVHWRPTQSGEGVARVDRPLDRWHAAFQSFSYAPWYAIHRSDSFRKAFTYAADVEEISSSRNVSTPLFIGMVALQGAIIKVPNLVSLREVTLAPNDPEAMDLWVGDWLSQRQFCDEVRQVEQRTRLALKGGGLVSTLDIDSAISAFRSFGNTLRHAPPKKFVTFRADAHRVARSVRRLARGLWRNEPGRYNFAAKTPVNGVRTVIGSDGFHSYGDEAKGVVWSRDDAVRTIRSLEVDQIAVVRHASELVTDSSP